MGQPTPSQTVGPFFGFAMPFAGDADAVAPGSPGAIRIEGQIFDGAGEPVTDAVLEAFEGDQFARCRTDNEGAFHFTVRRPAAVEDERGRRHAAHLNLMVFARGLLRHLATRIYFPGDQGSHDGDPLLAEVEPDRRRTLIARDALAGLRFDIHLQGPDETVFIAV